VAVTQPAAGSQPRLDRVLLGLHDYGTGLDEATLRVTANFAVDGIAAGENLAPRMARPAQGVWELRFKEPLASLPSGSLVVSIKDRQGNETRVERQFRVGP
jgi:hypothetical protein